MMRPNGVEKQVRPKWEWKPGANTVAYRPLNSTTTVTDQVNGVTLTNNGSVTFDDLGASTGSSKYLSLSSLTGMPTGNSDRTISVWFNMNAFSFAANYVYSIGSFSTLKVTALELYTSSTYIDYWNASIYYGTAMPTNTWTNAIFTNDSGTQKLYINGQEVGTSSQTLNTQNGLNIGGKYSNYYFDGKISKFIIENQAWTATDIANYYNSTKGDYGL